MCYTVLKQTRAAHFIPAIQQQCFGRPCYPPMTKTQVERILEQALSRLPLYFRRKIDNLVIVAQARPTAAQRRKYGARLLGLYEGVPLPERGQNYSGAMPDKITIFYRNIEEDSTDARAVDERLSHTLRHELAHYFGIDDARLLAKGNY